MKKILYVILSISLIMSLFAGCGKKGESVKSDADSQITTEAGNSEETDENKNEENTNVKNDDAEENSDTNGTVKNSEITIEHTKGTVTVSADVKKAVVFDFGILDIMDALKVEVEVAAPVSSLPSYLSKYENAYNAGSIMEPDLEAIFEFEPDVIFIGARQQNYYDQMSEIAPTVYVQTGADTYLEDVKKNIGYVAQIFGKEKEAQDAINSLSSLVEDVKALTANSNERVLIMLTNDGSISVYGSGSRFGMVHDLLGAKAADENIEASTHGQSVNFEYIADVNPDIILVIDRTLVVGGSNTANTVLDNDLVNGTNAAKNNKIISLDPDIWYLSGGGITSTMQMITDVKNAFVN
ncbi:iron complex transport system substrate-binding protein [Herbinix hemicellulosilytica]|uniref:Fe/B12 periplasmic-binding domain-containing protein n=1 Tax=Herbinix hemicellulosilytica TaxID=1564487 RepID=A0A0H5SIT1_HERHM|nr:siderophore ABC transporter substrate-binding protein [Herbinix hemicellulosilytica]RBP59153.1 iron complex transport system substrate-binding protein [Herbinix hemicellulosilytica]CRZ35404.1 hypothetical protein HHT355_2207 [Herbinix hemicellulosilytica]